MADASHYDAVVVSGGRMALPPLSQLLNPVDRTFRSNDVIGGGVGTAPLTLPNFIHDVCSAVYPLALGSPFLYLAARPKRARIHSPVPLAHPLDDGTAVVLAIISRRAKLAGKVFDPGEGFSRLRR